MIKREDVYKIGKIGKPHGVKGEMMFMISDDIFDRQDSDYIILDVDGLMVPFFIEEYRFRSDESVLLKLEDIDTAEQVRNLTGCDVYYERSRSDSEDEVTWAQIIGFNVVNDSDGATVGKILSVDDSTINLLFSLETDKGEILIPAQQELITDIDIKNQTIKMILPEGILSVND
ncbi:MAG: ribosome maturation factor RimM [Prevotella sp.]|jgi:16S rRNA processing protein RimM|nr:ribosome maturation factor RimM [Prevotella sp.]